MREARRAPGVVGRAIPRGFVGALFVLAASACSSPTDELPRPGTCDPFEVIGSSPADGSQAVSTDVVGAFRFNDFPDPGTVGPNNMTLWTGVYYHTGQFAISLVDRTASFRPASPLVPDRAYTLLLQPTVRSIRGCALQPHPATADGRPDPAYAVSFKTAAANAETMPPRPIAQPVSFADITSLFVRQCSGAGCHLQAPTGAVSEPGADCSEIPASGLSLCARDAHAHLVGIGAQEVPRLVRVAPHDSARSYLLRKLVGAPPVMGHEGTPIANQAGISTPDLHLLEAWIDSGAPAI